MAEKMNPPKASLGDYVHATARVVVGGVAAAVPVVGGFAGSAAVEVLSAVIAPPIEKRRAAWQENVASRLDELEKRGSLKIEDLPNNPAFVSTLLQASHAAIRTHQQEKLDALRNAIVNSALPDAPEDSLQHLFVGLVDDLTTWHVRLLRFIGAPLEYFTQAKLPVPSFGMMSSISQALYTAFPELRVQEEFVRLICTDLQSRSLVPRFEIHTMMTPAGAFEPRITGLGAAFIKFISEPASAGRSSTGGHNGSSQ